MFLKNNTDWMEVASEEAGEKGRFKYDFAPTNARYVKIELEERTMEIYSYCTVRMADFYSRKR
ncbi:MAG: hypothetical protein ACLUR5_10980 [Eubacterium ventriosum]